MSLYSTARYTSPGWTGSAIPVDHTSGGIDPNRLPKLGSLVPERNSAKRHASLPRRHGKSSATSLKNTGCRFCKEPGSSGNPVAARSRAHDRHSAAHRERGKVLVSERRLYSQALEVPMGKWALPEESKHFRPVPLLDLRPESRQSSQKFYPPSSG